MTKIKIKLKGRPSFLVEESEASKYLKDHEPVEKPAPKLERTLYTEKELYALNKAQQVAMIKEIDPNTIIPNLEAGRVQKLLDLGATK